MRKLVEAAGAADTLVTLWWLARGAPTPDLGAWTAPAPAWLWALLWTLLAGLTAGLAGMTWLCVQAQLGKG